MDTISGLITRLEAWRESGLAVASLTSIVIALLLVHLVWRRDHDKQPPSIYDKIPYISNTYQYLMDMQTFMERATKALNENSIVKFYLGPKPVYLLQGQQNIQFFFKPTHDFGAEGFMTVVFDGLWGFTPEDVAKFANDKTGRLKTPAPGSSAGPTGERYWYGTHHLYGEFLSRTYYANALADQYYRIFETTLVRATAPVGEWETVHVYDFIKQYMFESAVTSLNGPRLLDLNPDLAKIFWDFDEVAIGLAMSPPRWLNRKGYKRRDEFHRAVGRYLEAAWENFDWNGSDIESDWEENFGSRFSRELAKWLRDKGFASQSAAGFFSTIIFGLNSNTIPTAAWSLIELIRDPLLLRAARKEIEQVYYVDSATGEKRIDAQKLITLPILQAVFNETLRLHMSTNLTRMVVNPIELGGYKIGKGAFLQAVTQILNHDEVNWARDGHPASEFWAGRHLRYNQQEDGTKIAEFVLSAKANSFYPYGGGTGICPGRHFAKQEILMTLASIIARFDIEFVEWTNPDGSKSDRPASNDTRYSGAAALPPDRDMKIRWKRLW